MAEADHLVRQASRHAAWAARVEGLGDLACATEHGARPPAAGRLGSPGCSSTLQPFADALHTGDASAGCGRAPRWLRDVEVGMRNGAGDHGEDPGLDRGQFSRALPATAPLDGEWR